ncbi:MAG: lasso peptide biosynthesis PqqD family chaperone [Sulfurovum sp.]|nr:lasso peptide biosynthesis PqqD family chaperone [Sulfurovum sp.]MDD3499975.1 lasso peptide biosynthesis PqqD family chaperone [Sulfurovum sp.]
MLAMDKMIRRSTDVIASEMDDELVMMSMENNAYYGLNSVGRRVWELLETEQTLLSLCGQLMEKYDVDEAACQRDVSALVMKLEKAGLVTVV